MKGERNCACKTTEYGLVGTRVHSRIPHEHIAPQVGWWGKMDDGVQLQLEYVCVQLDPS